MKHLLRDGLSSRNGFVRKGARAILAIPKRIASLRASEEDFAARPPVLANSFPKSGTHLLAQIVEGLPERVNYGAFLGSETSSFQLRERSPDNTANANLLARRMPSLNVRAGEQSIAGRELIPARMTDSFLRCLSTSPFTSRRRPHPDGNNAASLLPGRGGWRLRFR